VTARAAKCQVDDILAPIIEAIAAVPRNA